MIENRTGELGLKTERESSPDVKIVKTTMENVLGTPMEEPKGLGLLAAPLIIASRKTGEQTEYFAVIDHPLAQQGMYQFLRRVANDKFNPGIYDVFFDWGMPDRAAKAQLSGEEDYNTRLQKMHETMNDSWTTFERHRRKFMDVINPDNGFGNAPETLDSPFLTLDQLPAYTRRQFRTEREFSQAAFNLVTKAFSKEEIIKLLLESRKGHGGVSKRERRMDPEVLRRRLLYRLYNSNQNKEQFYKTALGQQIIDNLVEANFDTYELPIGENETMEIYRRKFNGQEPKPLPKRISKPYRQFMSGKDVQVPFELVYEDGKIVYKRDDSVGNVFMIPAIHWTNGDTRLLKTDDDESKDMMQKIASKVPEFKQQPHIDSLLGLLSVAYFSPEIRQKWQEKAGLPSGRYEQFMGPGQMPVMAHIRRHELEKSSSILPALEQAADR